MTPEVRAVADRLILDAANLKYLASCIPAGGLDRPVEVLGWTVRQAIGHLVASQERYSNTIAGLLADGSTAANFRVDEFNAQAAEQTRTTPLPELLRRLDLSTARLLELFEHMPTSADDCKVDGRCLIDALVQWSGHLAEHGIDLVDALPELRFDPMILSWILYADYSGDERRFQCQLKLLGDVHERFGDDEEHDHDNEEDDDAF